MQSVGTMSPQIMIEARRDGVVPSSYVPHVDAPNLPFGIPHNNFNTSRAKTLAAAGAGASRVQHYACDIAHLLLFHFVGERTVKYLSTATTRSSVEQYVMYVLSFSVQLFALWSYIGCSPPMGTLSSGIVSCHTSQWYDYSASSDNSMRVDTVGWRGVKPCCIFDFTTTNGDPNGRSGTMWVRAACT